MEFDRRPGERSPEKNCWRGLTVQDPERKSSSESKCTNQHSPSSLPITLLFQLPITMQIRGRLLEACLALTIGVEVSKRVGFYGSLCFYGSTG